MKTKKVRAKTKFHVFWSKTIFFRITIFLRKPFTKIPFFPAQERFLFVEIAQPQILAPVWTAAPHNARLACCQAPLVHAN